MTARTRIVAVTTVVAAAAAVAAVAVGALQGERSGSLPAQAPPAVREGAPPLALDLGVRDDTEARELRRAEQLYLDGRRRAAAALFERHDSLEARVGSAYAAWPDGTVDRLSRLAGLHARRAVVQLHLGIALLWSGGSGAEDALRAAAEAEPDTLYAVTAGNLLHPEFARGLPVFVPTAALPDGLDALSPSEQLELLRRSAAGSVDGKLLYGAALQRLGRQRSAARAFAAAAAKAPGDAEAQVAAAVGLFDKARPATAFSRLGPLTRRFPGRATVRFHLGLLLLWSGEVPEAKRQLELARRAEPASVPGREAARYLTELRKRGI